MIFRVVQYSFGITSNINVLDVYTNKLFDFQHNRMQNIKVQNIFLRELVHAQHGHNLFTALQMCIKHKVQVV